MTLNLLQRIRSDDRGAAVIEMAFAMPVLIMIMIGMLQFAIVLQANGAIRHGIGEGLRLAKVNSGISDSDVFAEVDASIGGIKSANVTFKDFDKGTTSSGVSWGRLTVRYEITPVIPFASLGKIRLQETRRVYLPE